MKAICEGRSTRADVVHQSLEQYREVFIRTNQQIGVLKDVSPLSSPLYPVSTRHLRIYIDPPCAFTCVVEGLGANTCDRAVGAQVHPRPKRRARSAATTNSSLIVDAWIVEGET